MEAPNPYPNLTEEQVQIIKQYEELKKNPASFDTILPTNYPVLLRYAAFKGFLPVVQLLVKQCNYSPDNLKDGLFIAVGNGRIAAANHLKQAGATLTDLNQLDLISRFYSGNDKLHTLSPHINNAIRWILDNSTNHAIKMHTWFQLCDSSKELCQQLKQPETLTRFAKLIHRQPSSANTILPHKLTLLNFFSQNGLVEAVKIILPHVDSVNTRTEDNSWFPTTIVVNESGDGHVLNKDEESLLCLPKYGPLFYARYNNHKDIAEILEERGAKLTVDEKIELFKRK